MGVVLDYLGYQDDNPEDFDVEKFIEDVLENKGDVLLTNALAFENNWVLMHHMYLRN